MNTTETRESWSMEIADRTRRIETRLYRLCEHMGMEKNNLLVPDSQEAEESMHHAIHRIRCIETSLHQLREHVGMETFSIAKKILVHPITAVVSVPGFDVTLASIKAALLSEGMYEESVPFVLHISGIEVADIIFTESS